MDNDYDFSGYATRFNIQCADGRTIRKGAFSDCDGKVVPLVWNHQHDAPTNVLGHALLENREDGVYAYCKCNDTVPGEDCKKLIHSGDVDSLSIYANDLKENRGDVLHGMIREVSVVLAGANPGAYIDSILAHGEDSEEGAIIYSGDTFDDLGDSEEEEANVINNTEENTIQHSCGGSETKKKNKKLEQSAEDTKDSIETGKESDDSEDNSDDSNDDEETIEDVVDSMTDKQRNVMFAIIGQAIEDANGTDDESESENDSKDSTKEEDNKDMKHNAFDKDNEDNSLSHGLTEDEESTIISDAKRFGSLKDSFLQHSEEMGIKDIKYIAHAGTSVVKASGTSTYGINDPDFLFPDARLATPTPTFIRRNNEWVAGVMSGVKNSPFSRIKSIFADITEDDARAKGYIKGKLKKEEVFSLLKRTTTPTTIYKKQKMDRDDIVDITDFDVVAWIKTEMREMLDEEIARAILVGDGRLASSDDKVNESNIRPIWTDEDLFTIKRTMTVAANATDDEKAKMIIKEAVKARKDYKGSGNPIFYTTEDTLTICLLLEDTQGHRLYNNANDLAAAMRVSSIVTVPVMENLTRTVTSGASSAVHTLAGLIVNLNDYTVGADKGGAVAMFDDFDIDYNQQKYLIETRCSGALTVPYSAITLETTPAVG